MARSQTNQVTPGNSRSQRHTEERQIGVGISEPVRPEHAYWRRPVPTAVRTEDLTSVASGVATAHAF